MIDNRPLVSIVTPAYNQADYLRETIESVLAQDYAEIEYIVLDDGSTDHTRDVLSAYGARFYWESQANMGQASTLNKGWQRARGEILAYLSADDTLMPQAVRRAVETLAAHPDAVLCYCDYRLMGPRSDYIRTVKVPEYNYYDLVVRQICQPGPGAFFRRAAFARAGLWDNTLRQLPDYDYWLRMGLVGRFIRIPEVLAAFRVHEGSQSFAGADELRARESVRIIERYFNTEQPPPAVAAARAEAFSMANIAAARMHLRSGRYHKALASLREAAQTYPRSFLSLYTHRMIANGLFNRMGHKMLWTIKDSLSRWTGRKQ